MKDTQKSKAIYDSARSIEELIKPIIAAANGLYVIDADEMADRIRSETAFIKANSGAAIRKDSHLMERALQYVSEKGIDISFAGELKAFLTHCQNGTGDDLYTDEKVNHLGRTSMMLALDVVSFLVDNHDEEINPIEYASPLCWDGEGLPFVGQVVSMKASPDCDEWVDRVVTERATDQLFAVNDGKGRDGSLWPVHAFRAAGYRGGK